MTVPAAGSVRPSSPTVATLVLGIVLVVGGLIYLPSLLLRPVDEGLTG
jgi:K+-transporting ATPase A subunit